MLLDPDLGYYDEGLDLTDAALYAGARRNFGEATTLPPAGYRSKVFSALEDNRLWVRSWVAVGLQQQLPEPGDLLPFTIGYHGIHLQRLEDGSLAGRFNKAQHGGCRSVPLQCQTGARTRCSFTSCGYSRDRDVIPSGELEADGSAAQQYLGLIPERLLPVRIETWGPLLFACLDPRTPALAEQVGGLDWAQRFWPGTGQGLIGREWLTLPANWKLVAPALRALLAPPEARCQYAEPEQGSGSPLAFQEWPSSEAGGGLSFAWLFPNLLVIRREDITAVVLLQPLSMTETQLRLFLLDEGAAPGERAGPLLRDWRALLSRVGETARQSQERLGAWGTPSRPETRGEAPPIQEDPLGWRFQSYLIDRILDEAT